MAEKVEIVVSAKDEATGKLKKVTVDLEDMKKTMSALGYEVEDLDGELRQLVEVTARDADGNLIKVKKTLKEVQAEMRAAGISVQSYADKQKKAGAQAARDAQKQSDAIQRSVMTIGKNILRIGSMVTVATIAMFAGVTRAAFQAGREAADAVKTATDRVKEAQSNLSAGLQEAGGGAWSDETRAKIAELRKELALAKADFDAMPGNVKKAAVAYSEIEKALAPVKNEMMGITAEILTALVPTIKEIAPDLVTLAKSVAGLVHEMTPLVVELTPAIKAFVELLAVGAHFAGKVPWAAIGASTNTKPLTTAPGFANGGSFRVGGSGGTDSQLVQFRATPGEQVTVGGGGKQMVEVNVYLDGSALAGVVKRIVQRGY